MFPNMLAEVSAQDAAWIVITGAGVILGVFAKINSAKKSITDEMMATLRNELAALVNKPAQNVAVQQPLQVTEAEKFASAAAFSRHAAADREEHEKLRTETLRVEREMIAKLEEVKTDILKEGREREDRLSNTIRDNHEKEQGRVDKLIETVGQLKGTVTEMARKGGAK